MRYLDEIFFSYDTLLYTPYQLVTVIYLYYILYTRKNDISCA